MKHRIFTLVAAIAVLVAAASSCIKDDGILYHDLTEFGVVDGNRILSDQGVVLHIADQICNAKLDTMHRIVYVCDITKQISDLEYEIVLKEVQSVKELTPVLSTSPEAAAREFDDPVYVNSSWFGGGYLNVTVSYYEKRDSKTPHTFLVVEYPPVYDDDLGAQVDINLMLYHEGGGESYENPAYELSDLVQVSRYLSFPVAELDPYRGEAPKGGMNLRLGRRWHTYDSDVIERDTEIYYSYGSFQDY